MMFDDLEFSLEIAEGLKFSIERGKLISAENVDRLKKMQARYKFCNNSYFFQLPYEKGSFPKFHIEIICKCNTRFIEHMSKTDFCLHIKGKEYICDLCSEKQEEKEKKIRENNEKKRIEKDRLRVDQIAEETQDYIDTYCSKEMSWNEDCPGSKRFRYIFSTGHLDIEKIADHLKSLPYQEFLNTPYWVAVSWKVKQLADFKCQICNSKELLESHHRTYKVRGYEAFGLKDLICICRNCHQTHHESKNSHTHKERIKKKEEMKMVLEGVADHMRMKY